MVQIPAHWALCLDGMVAVLAFAIKVLLLWITVKTISHGTAAISVKGLIYSTLGLAAIYFFANPMLQTEQLFAPLAIVVLVGALVYKRVFWISLDRAILASVLVSPLCIFVGDYSRRGLDAMYPLRATINMSAAAAIDDCARAHSHETNLPSSVGTLSALVRLTVTTNTTGPVGSTLAFFRAGLEAKEYVERLRKQSEMEARLANLLSGGGTNLTNRKQELTAMKEFFGESTNAPPPRYHVMNTYTGAHGYAAAYASAKAQIEEINRIASNNAEIVNFLSDAGTNVGTRAEEMGKLQKALIEEAERSGIDLSSTSAVDMAIVSQAVDNVTSTSSLPTAAASLVDALTANMLARQPPGSDTVAAVTASPSGRTDELWKVAADDLSGLTVDVAGTNAASSMLAQGPPGALPEGQPATIAPGDVPLMWTGCLAAPGSLDVRCLVLGQLSALELQSTDAPPPPRPAPPRKKSVYETMRPEDRNRWLVAQHQIKVTGVVHSKTDVSAFVGGKMIRSGSDHCVSYEGTNYTFRLRGVNTNGQCVWEPVLPTNFAAQVSIGF